MHKVTSALIGKHIHSRHADKPHTLSELKALAILIRKNIILMLLEAESGHSAGALGMVEVYTALYFSLLKHRPHDPTWEKRDRVVVSNGHTCPVLYATLAEAGYFPKAELKTLRKINSRLQGHPEYGSLPGIENTSGPLGQGFSQAIGMAIAAKMDKLNTQIYCILSDAEHAEGQIWESYLYAGAHNLNNLTIIIDRNQIQIGGYTEEILPLNSLSEKISSFRFAVIEIDGNSIQQVLEACKKARETTHAPTAIICNTVAGKGIEFMEYLPEWHGKPPNAHEAKTALDSLRSLKGKIWWE